MNVVKKNKVGIIERLKHVIKHNIAVNKIYRKYFLEEGDGIPWSIRMHDLDKIPYILFSNKTREQIKNIHRKKKLHHSLALASAWFSLNELEKSARVIEHVCDSESARFTKPDKQSTARQFFEKVTKNDPSIPARMLEMIDHKIKIIEAVNVEIEIKKKNEVLQQLQARETANI